MTSLKLFIPNFFDIMWARSDKEMAEGFPTMPMVTARIWKAWSRMHQFVTFLTHSVDNEGANTEFRSWHAHLSSPAAALSHRVRLSR